MSTLTQFRGIFAPVATPFTADDQVDLAALAANTRVYGKTKLSGLVVLGSNGEFALLSHQEKIDAVALVREELPSHMQIIAGVGCESTAETIQLCKEAAAVGAAAALIVTPWYYKGSYTDAVLEKHYLAIAEVSPIPVMLYNMPRNAGVNMSAALVAKLGQHPNIVGVKDSSGDIVQIANYINNTPEDFAVFAGSGSFLMATTVMGGVGGTLAVANIMPNTCADLFEASVRGDLVTARSLQQRIMVPNAAVTSRFGISGLKKAMDLLGLQGGNPRLPLQPVSESDAAEIAKILEVANASADWQ